VDADGVPRIANRPTTRNATVTPAIAATGRSGLVGATATLIRQDHGGIDLDHIGEVADEFE